ncbi:MAG: MerR family transcriptional regulator [Lactobacillus sp.]|nr:MerR family transcriptional regulator [Lactobacillus panisapium]MCO6531536.1 MerR family transcriptional regulator [Lactobacillus sp.]QYN59488.1 MerR family transcriptional regulator [Lactobacillus panisapium]
MMKKYQIKDVSDLLGVSTYTLRYYEKIGLLNFVKRNKSGVREFEASDLITINTIICLKQTGMPLKEIKKYLKLVGEGIDTAEQRKAMFLQQRQKVTEEIAALKKSMKIIDRKINFYDEAIKEQSLDVCRDDRKKWLEGILAGKEKVQ